MPCEDEDSLPLEDRLAKAADRQADLRDKLLGDSRMTGLADYLVRAVQATANEAVVIGQAVGPVAIPIIESIIIELVKGAIERAGASR